MRWSQKFAAQVIQLATQNKLITRTNGHLELTLTGRRRAQETMEY
jgi:hypothetical protein